MKKRTAISFPILAIFLLILCLGAGALVCPLFFYMAPTVSVMLSGPPDHLLTPEKYAQFIVSNSAEVDESEVEIVQLQRIQAPETIWIVYTHYESENEINTRVLSFEDRGDGTLHIYPAFYENYRSNDLLEFTVQVFGNDSGSQIAVFGEVYDEEISRVLVSWTDDFQEEAIIANNTFLLVSELGQQDRSSEKVRIMAYTSAGKLISELTLPLEE